MSVSLILFHDPEGRGGLDLIKVRSSVQNLQGVTDWHDEDQIASNNLLFDCFFEFNQDVTTIFAFKGNSPFVSMRGTGDASLKAALEIQKGYGSPIYVAVSEDPGNMVDLSGVASIAELRARLDQ